MAVISGGKVIEGALVRPASSASDSTVGSFGPFLNAGVPVDGAAGTQFGVAAKGALLIDTTNAKLYINGGTLAVPVWKLVTSAA
jgi:hypothetical protein